MIVLILTKVRTRSYNFTRMYDANEDGHVYDHNVNRATRNGPQIDSWLIDVLLIGYVLHQVLVQRSAASHHAARKKRKQTWSAGYLDASELVRKPSLSVFEPRFFDASSSMACSSPGCPHRLLHISGSAPTSCNATASSSERFL